MGNIHPMVNVYFDTMIEFQPKLPNSITKERLEGNKAWFIDAATIFQQSNIRIVFQGLVAGFASLQLSDEQLQQFDEIISSSELSKERKDEWPLVRDSTKQALEYFEANGHLGKQFTNKLSQTKF